MLLQRGGFFNVYLFRDLLQNLLPHLEDLGRDEDQSDLVLRKCIGKRMNCPAVPQVPDEPYRGAVNGSKLLLDCVEIKQCLGRMLLCSRPRVNYGDP